jgi:hypothetical protein
VADIFNLAVQDIDRSRTGARPAYQPLYPLIDDRRAIHGDSVHPRKSSCPQITQIFADEIMAKAG